MPEYKIRTNKEPTYWNKEAAAGFVLGFIPGAIIGALIGKDRMRDEQQYGKTVKEPSMLNMNIFPGVIKGSIFGAVAWIGMSTAAVALLASGFGVLAGALAVGAWVVGSVAPIVGGYQGAISGKKQMAAEYAQAKAEYENGHSQQRSTSPTTERIAQQEYNYGPDHPALQAEQKGKVWANDTQLLPPSQQLAPSR